MNQVRTPHPPRLAVLVADDDARVRRGLREIIEFSADVAVAGEASSAKKTLQLDRALTPDVVILDLHLPEADDGMRVLRELAARGRPVVAISVSRALRPQAMATGASAFLEKGSELIEKLLQEIRAAAMRAQP